MIKKIKKKINNKLNKEIVIEKKAVEEMQQINIEYENKVKELVNVINSLKQANDIKKNNDSMDNQNNKNNYGNNKIKSDEIIIENTISINIYDKKDPKNSKLSEINEKARENEPVEPRTATKNNNKNRRRTDNLGCLSRKERKLVDKVFQTIRKTLDGQEDLSEKLITAIEDELK